MSNRSYPYNNDAGQNDQRRHLPLSGKDTYLQTSMKQYPTRAFRAEHRERQTQEQHANYDHALEYQRRACAVPCDAGCQAPTGTERAGQIYARGELYSDQPVNPDQERALAHQSRPLSVPPSVRRPEQFCARVPAVEMREQRQYDAAEYRARGAEHPAQGTQPTYNAAQRAGNFSVSAARAEKEQYADSYKEGNEDAYAHVEALQRSVRGYEDTSKATMDRVKAWNAREGRQRSFLAAF